MSRGRTAGNGGRAADEAPLISFGALGCDFRMPLAAAHARDLDRLKQSGYAERFVDRERFGGLAVRHVDDEYASQALLSVLGQEAATENDLVLVPLQIGEMGFARRLADRQAVGPVFVVQNVKHPLEARVHV